MAKIVLGMATSHGPLLSTPPEQWGERAKADRANPALWFRGQPYKYDALEALRVGRKARSEMGACRASVALRPLPQGARMRWPRPSRRSIRTWW